ncbi:MAG: EAL domain-containing response regulator [Gammaproteobacteria bacterium]|nr:EAL domain-containing response regulator [Gammaproteobacteria bacterium]
MHTTTLDTTQFGQAAKPNILIVDDEPDISGFIGAAAKKNGFEISVLNDSSQFATKYNDNTDLIFLDLFMPGMDGIELIRFLASSKSRASLVLMSGSDSTILHSAKELAKAHGINVLGALEKPIRLKELNKTFSSYSPNNSQTVASVSNDEFPSADELDKAIKECGLSLSCQPQISMATGKLAGVEMLARWTHPTKGAITPGYFVPLAEKSSLIGSLTDYVVSKSLQQAGAWINEGVETRVSINMSPLNLIDVELPEKISDMAKDNKVNPEKVVIEITETAFAQDIARYLDILTRFRMKGFVLSIDDFGTGYSSMGQLLRAPFNELKIDQSFVQNIHTDKESRIIISGSIKMAHNLGLKVVAEGIETEADWDFLCAQGCDEGQGYWMARPMPTANLAEWINTRK